jgi:hypothetical protein
MRASSSGTSFLPKRARSIRFAGHRATRRWPSTSRDNRRILAQRETLPARRNAKFQKHDGETTDLLADLAANHEKDAFKLRVLLWEVQNRSEVNNSARSAASREFFRTSLTFEQETIKLGKMQVTDSNAGKSSRELFLAS